jgi:hypothetical protein
MSVPDQLSLWSDESFTWVIFLCRLRNTVGWLTQLRDLQRDGIPRKQVPLSGNRGRDFRTPICVDKRRMSAKRVLIYWQPVSLPKSFLVVI